MNKDLTVGKPSTVLWKFCLPLFGSIIFQQIYNIADSLVAGKFIGENALAAVGNSYEITLIFIAIAFGANMGCSVVVSRLFGAKRFGDMKTAVHTAVVSAAVLSAVLMAVGLIWGGDILRLIRTQEDLFADSKLYLDIYSLGLPFLLFYYIATGIFSALGDSKTPFIFLSASSTANILVDILFVAGFGMGVDGVAWATFLCQGISCVLSMIVAFRRMASIQTDEKPVWFSKKALGQIAVVAVPSILQQSSISVGNIIIQGVINSFQSAGIVAGYAAAVKLNNLVITSLTTLANGVSNYVAQNIGANKLERIREGMRASLKIVWSICIPIILIYWLGAGILVNFFIDEPSADAMYSGVMFLRIVSPFYMLTSAKLALDGILRGASMMKRFMVGTFADLIVRVVLAVLFAKALGIIGVWCAWPLGWISGFIPVVFFYRGGPWMKKSLQAKQERF